MLTGRCAASSRAVLIQGLRNVGGARASGERIRLGDASSGRGRSVSPETLFGETPNTTRGTQRDAYAPRPAETVASQCGLVNNF